jgi:hypothetical protein
MINCASLLLALALQAPAAQPATRPVGSTVAPDPAIVSALVAPWRYPRVTRAHFVQQSILPREVDVLRMRTTDSAEVVESYYRARAAAEGGPVAIVNAVGQRIVSHAGTLVSIEPANGYTVITVIATEPDPEPASEGDPARPKSSPLTPLTPRRALRLPPS